MRKTLLAVSALTLLACSGYSQTTNTPPSGLVDFGNTVLNYFTSFNTNLDTTFKDNRFQFWIGASSMQNALNPLVNDIGGSYDLWRPKMSNTNSPTFTGISFEGLARNSGVAGTVISAQGGIGFSVTIHDAQATLYGDAGAYMLGAGALYGEVGVRVKKAIGPHFYMGVGIGVQFRPSGPEDARHPQVLSAFGGATF